MILSYVLGAVILIVALAWWRSNTSWKNRYVAQAAKYAEQIAAAAKKATKTTKK